MVVDMSNFSPVSTEQQREVLIDSALQLTHAQLESADQTTSVDTALTVVDWLDNNHAIGHARQSPLTDFRRNSWQVVSDKRAPGDVAVVFVDEQSPASQDRLFRTTPAYSPKHDAIFLPFEASVHPYLLADALVHEGSHAHYHRFADLERAEEVLPGVDNTRANYLLSEIKAYEVGYVILGVLLGHQFTKLAEKEVEIAGQAAIEAYDEFHGGYPAHPSIDTAPIIEALEERVSFLDYGDLVVTMQHLASTITTGMKIRTAEWVATHDERFDDTDPVKLVSLKVHCLQKDYRRDIYNPYNL